MINLVGVAFSHDLYAPLLNRPATSSVVSFSPCFVEHHNLLRLDVKSRCQAGSVIYYFLDSFYLDVQ